MIAITVTLADGIVAALDSRGHARKRGNASIPCAAVSALLRAFVAAVGDSPEVSGEGNAPSEGALTLRIRHASDPRWLRGASDTLLNGLRQVEADFPRDVELRVSSEAADSDENARKFSE